METVTSEFLALLRAKTQLSALVGEHVNLTRAGREWKGLCPFHREKTPSFVVNDEKGFYHCFGCGAHGDAVRFLTDSRGLFFKDAVQELAQLAGLGGNVGIGAVEEPRPAPEENNPHQHEWLNEEAQRGSRSRRGGARLNRSDTVTVRFDPTLNYLSELAARSQRRTKSSFIEWAVELALRQVKVAGTETPYDDELKTIAHLAPDLWDVDEPDRLAKLAFHAPSLMTHEDQLIWKLVRENGLLWLGGYSTFGEGEWSWQVKPENLRWGLLREHWDTFKAVAAGEQPLSHLPTWQRTRERPSSAFDADLDDDSNVPF